MPSDPTHEERAHTLRVTLLSLSTSSAEEAVIAQAIREAESLAFQKGLEEAAKVCEEIAEASSVTTRDERGVASILAEKIRARSKEAHHG